MTHVEEGVAAAGPPPAPPPPPPAAGEPFTVIDPATCELRGDPAGLEYRRLYDAPDGVVGICWQAAGFDHAAHWHRADELIYSVGGRALTLVGEEGREEGREEDGGAWADVEAGQCIVPASMVAHRTKTPPSARYECLYFFPDGPQDGRQYYSSGASAARVGGAGERAAAGVPHVSATTLAGIDPEAAAWHQVVEGAARWSAAVVVLAAGAAATSARQHAFCYVLQGRVRCDDGGGASAVAAQSQLVRVGAGALARWCIAAEDGATARVLLCVHKSHKVS